MQDGIIKYVNFGWDAKKAKQNSQKHSVSFEEAVTVFYDQLSATFEDTDHSIGEQRYLTVGYSSRVRLLVVSHADINEIIRIISARIATAYERKKHEG
jgi:uncharacterized DUF497 family protein